jgi:hypothetical protein
MVNLYLVLRYYINWVLIFKVFLHVVKWLIFGGRRTCGGLPTRLSQSSDSPFFPYEASASAFSSASASTFLILACANVASNVSRRDLADAASCVALITLPSHSIISRLATARLLVARDFLEQVLRCSLMHSSQYDESSQSSHPGYAIQFSQQ